RLGLVAEATRARREERAQRQRVAPAQHRAELLHVAAVGGWAAGGAPPGGPPWRATRSLGRSPRRAAARLSAPSRRRRPARPRRPGARTGAGAGPAGPPRGAPGGGFFAATACPATRRFRHPPAPALYVAGQPSRP